MENSVEFAENAYRIIQKKAEDNTVVQSISGIFGFPWTIGTDIAVIPTIYFPLWERIRELYLRKQIESDVAGSIIKGTLSEIFVDIALDKFLGNVPLIGIYFNAICAKMMTWRLGILFTMLSARGEEVDVTIVRDCMVLIRLVFPQKDMFTFVTPNQEHFIKLITGMSDITQDDFKEKVDQMLDMMNANKNREGTSPEN
jgi:hypothetical protein